MDDGTGPILGKLFHKLLQLEWAEPLLFLGCGNQVDIEDSTNGVVSWLNKWSEICLSGGEESDVSRRSGFVSGSGVQNSDKQVAANLVMQRVGNCANLSRSKRTKSVSFSPNVAKFKPNHLW